MCLGVLKCRLRITLEKTQQYYLMTLCLVAIGKANVAVLCAWCRDVRFVLEMTPNGINLVLCNISFLAEPICTAN